MAKVLMFAAMRQATGTGSAEISGATVGEVLTAASARYGPKFDEMLPYCMVLLDDEKTDTSAEVDANAEIALLPPVSGGAF